MVDNTKSIVDNDPKFSKVYLAEKEVLLTFLNEESVGSLKRLQGWG